MVFLGWDIGDTQVVSINGAETPVEIVGITRGEISRTMYFIRGELTEITGINATSVYLVMPDGVEIDTQLGEISAGIVERQTLIDGIESLIEQQTQIFQAIMYLGLLFTIAVMLNTMIMNVAERDFELATLRVLGASTKRLGGMYVIIRKFTNRNYRRHSWRLLCLWWSDWFSRFILLLGILCSCGNRAKYCISVDVWRDNNRHCHDADWCLAFAKNGLG